MRIREVAVIGLGTMGAGIAEVFARAGLGVTAVEADPQALARGMAAIGASLDRAVSRGRLAGPEREAILGRISPAEAVAGAAGADLVVEVVPERMEIKRQVFAELDRACRPDAILATNTSSLPVTAIAAGTAHPGRVVGMHFFNPAPVMRLVEVVTTVLTTDATARAVTHLASRLGKTPVAVTDRAGFVANALLLPYLNHAAALAGMGYASREDIDTAMRLGAGLPMGPLALLDLIGLDTSLSILQVLAAEFGGTRCTPAPLLRRLTEAGMTGRKSGRGCYEYAAGAARPAAGAGDGGGDGAGPPGLVTLIPAGWGQQGGPGAGPAGSGPGEAGGDRRGEPDAGTAALAAMIERSGIGVHVAGAGGPRDASGTGGSLVIVATGPAGGVAAAARAAGAPGAVGLHVTGDALAEVVVTATAPPDAAAAAAALARHLGLTPVRCPDRPGLLAAALLYPHLNDAIRMVQEGYANAAGIDAAMVLGCGYPKGPCQLADEIGPERVRGVLAALHTATGDPAFAPAPLLAEYAAAGLAFRP